MTEKPKSAKIGNNIEDLSENILVILENKWYIGGNYIVDSINLENNMLWRSDWVRL